MISLETKKYIRQGMLPEVGIAGQQRIRSARVLIIRCGGLGCPALLYLASAGVGTIGIADFDVVTISNLHRQVLFGNPDVGTKKAVRAAELLMAQHPEVQVIPHDVRVTE